jgi:hypothetical protein
MAADAEDLLIRPLRDVVAVGHTALSNATTQAPHQTPGPADHVDPMSRAAQALVREGERALHKVQLVWRDQVNKYGDGFREMMVQQGKDSTAVGCRDPAPPLTSPSFHRKEAAASRGPSLGL